MGIRGVDAGIAVALQRPADSLGPLLDVGAQPGASFLAGPATMPRRS